MTENRLPWLLKCADKLRTSHSDSVDIAQLLTQLGVGFKTVTGQGGHGELRIDEGRGFRVIIKTDASNLLWSHRERFAAAHELAHLLLLRKWNYRPERSYQREYFQCETLCNRFAGRLLINPKAVSQVDCDSPQGCIDGILKLASQYNVSCEVAAKELAMSRSGVAVCSALVPEKVITWGVCSIGNLKVTRKRAFQSPRYPTTSNILIEPETARACIAWLYDRLPAVSADQNFQIGTRRLGRSELVSIIVKETPVVIDSRRQADGILPELQR